MRFQARGASMSPAIRDGEVVEVTPVIVTKLRKDDIVLAKSNSGFRLHRIVHADPREIVSHARGLRPGKRSGAEGETQILGLARAKEVRVGRKIVQARFRGVGGWALRCAARGAGLAAQVGQKPVALRGSSVLAIALGILVLLLFHVSFWRPSCGRFLDFLITQYSGHWEPIALPSPTPPPAGANRLLLVSVSMNVTTAPTAAVSGRTCNRHAAQFPRRTQ